MGLSFFNDEVTVIRAPVFTKNGAPYRDWSNAEEIKISNVLVTAGPTTQDFAGRLQNISDTRTLRANYEADIKEGDRVAYGGDLYEVSGEVFHTKSPTGRVSNTRCTLARWVG